MTESRHSNDWSATTPDDGKKIRGATLIATLTATVLLFAFVLVQAWCSNLGSALTLSGSLLAVGYLVGLLFAVPKSVAVAQPVGTEASRAPEDARTLRSPISVNTNFEQISDWLTKIIVGVGLVQARPIYEAGAVAAGQVGAALQCGGEAGGGGAVLGASILLGFPTLGLILGFFSVRLYISRAVYAADLAINQNVNVLPSKAAEVIDDIPLLAPRRSASGSIPTSTAPAKQAVKQVLSQSFDTLTTPDDQITWGKASLAAGNYEDSQRALRSAISQVGDRPDAALAYVQALYGASNTPDYATIVSVLEGARRRVDSTTNLSIRQRITEELLNAYLYSDPPAGFKAALRLLDEYLAGDGKGRADAYVYGAAAHGQKYAWLKVRNDAGAATELPIVLALSKKAIDLGGDETRQWLRTLATSSGGDDDLAEAAKDSKELQSLLSLPEPA